MTETASPRPSPYGAGKLLLQLLLTGLVTWFILRAIGFNLADLKSFDLASLEPNWGILALSTLVLLMAYVYSASLWGLMVREFGAYEIRFIPSLRVFFTANLGRYLPGKLWQIAGMAYLAKGEGVAVGHATGAAILGQAFSLAGATLIGAGVLLGSGRGATLGGPWAAGVLIILLLGATSGGLLKGLLPLWFKLAREEIPVGFQPDRAFGVRWMGLYAIGWILQGLAFWILVRGLGFDLTPQIGVPAYPAAYVAGYVMLFAPAGVGVREGVLVAFLGPALGAGAAVVALMARLWTTMVELLPALVLAGGYLGPSKKEESEGV